MQTKQKPREVAEWIEKLAWLMDNAIKIGPWSIGLDGFIGLIPGIGDATGGLISSLIVLAAVQAGIPRVTVLRMMSNVAIDSLIGAVPFLGDFFDFTYKANAKNVVIFREALRGERRESRDLGFLIVILFALFALIVIPIVSAFYLILRLIR